MSYPDFDRSFIIYTDASGIGLGAVLSQVKGDQKEHVIAYASRSLSPAEKNYSVTDQECLAVVWAIKHFQHYLGMKPFTLITDHSALKWLQTSKMPKGRRARWVMELQQYDFTIKHRPGKQNANADALSRIPEIEVNCFVAKVKQRLPAKRRKLENDQVEVTLEMLEIESEASYEADSEDNETDDERILYNPRNKGKAIDRGYSLPPTPPPEDFPLPPSRSESIVSEDRNHFDELQPLVTPAYTFSA